MDSPAQKQLPDWSSTITC